MPGAHALPRPMPPPLPPPPPTPSPPGERETNARATGAQKSEKIRATPSPNRVAQSSRSNAPTTGCNVIHRLPRGVLSPSLGARLENRRSREGYKAFRHRHSSPAPLSPLPLLHRSRAGERCSLFRADGNQEDERGRNTHLV